MIEVLKVIAVALITGLLTLAGVMTTSVTGWWSTSQTSEIAKRQACIARLDTHEQNFRAKADLFLGSLGSFVALTGHTKFTLEEYHERLDGLMKTGYTFSAYAPALLSVVSINMVNQLKSAVKEQDDKAFSETMNRYNASYEKWHVQFQKRFDDIESERHDC